MRGRKRHRKKWIKKHFIEIVPGLLTLRNPAQRTRQAYITLGAWEAIRDYVPADNGAYMTEVGTWLE